MTEDHHERERFGSRAAFYFAAVGSGKCWMYTYYVWNVDRKS